MDPYPVRFAVEYPDRNLDRLTSFFRILTVIPILIVVGAISGFSSGYTETGEGTAQIVVSGVGILFLPALLLILFRGRYPRWWFDWNLELLRFLNRVAVYALLMDDRYPSTEDQQAVRLELPYPDVEAELNRGLPLVKWFLAIPHYIVLFFLHIGVFFAVVIAWFAILFTAGYPRGLFDYVEGVLRWHNRVVGYAFALVTDRYPPFSLRE
ncbi:MAG TPA: DUF4389 domain-containing protein [Solirubrobacterales bacterium]|nr:DUF4389 domain-containing protein [Solirubrobacterales bacterium]